MGHDLVARNRAQHRNLAARPGVRVRSHQRPLLIRPPLRAHPQYVSSQPPTGGGSPEPVADLIARIVPSRPGFPRLSWPACARAAGSDARRTAVPADRARGPGRKPERRSGRSGAPRSPARWRLELRWGSLLLALGVAPSDWSMIWRQWRALDRPLAPTAERAWPGCPGRVAPWGG